MADGRPSWNIYYLVLQLLLVCWTYRSTNAEEMIGAREPVRVNKCCEKFEVLSDSICTHANDTDTETWKPVFTSYDGKDNIQVNYKFAVGLPDCRSTQSWPIFHYPGSSDKLYLLQDGKLRHYVRNTNDDDIILDEDDTENRKPISYDYDQGQYCLEKAISTTSVQRHSIYAKVCTPEKHVSWYDTDFLLRKIINPVFHGISIIILLIIAIIYFVLPTLRDLVGNIVTTITLCLIVSQVADLIRIFTELSSHVSILIADTILYISLLAAFLWLNSLGYYVWKTFRSRNVFLRVTDGRKYCWYSVYAWGITSVMAALAIFSNYFLDSTSSKKIDFLEDQETIGVLGIAIFFSPIAITIIINIFFYVTTLKLINRRNVYGRIQHKLKSNFVMFTLLLCIMSVTWMFLILSWIRYDSLLYNHIIMNAIQAPLILYVCVFKPKHVTFLLKKCCCYNDPTTTGEWGDEMHYINGNDY